MTIDVAAARARAVRMLWTRRAFMAIFLGGVFALPLALDESRAYIVGWALCSSIVGLSMNVLAGYAGQISLAQAVLFGTGAFALGNLATRSGVPWLISLPLAGLATAGIAMLIGFPALRIRGLNLAIATIGFQFAMQRVAFRAEQLTGGAAGVDVHRPTLFGASTDTHATLLFVILIVLTVLWVLDRNLTRSRAGRAFFALRQDEQVAASFGIAVARYKLLAFAISGFYAGIGGALYGTLVEDVTAELFEYTYSFEFLVFAVLGGLGSRAGTAVGAAFPVLYRSFFESLAFTGALLGGLLLVFTLIRYPGGLAAQGRELVHIARALWKVNPLAAAALLPAIAISIAAGVLAAYTIANVIESIIGLFGAGVTFPVILSIVIALGVLAAAFQVIVRALMRWAHAPATHAAPPAEDVEGSAAPEVSRIQMSNPSVTFRRPGPRAPSRAPLLEVQDLAIRFGGVRALDGVSLEVREGELIGIMGPNGSGKTTLLNNISGFLTPNSGDIRFRGKSILRLPPHDRAALGIGRTFQHVGLVKNETAFDNFLIAQHLVCRYGPLEGIVRTGGVVREERRLRERARAAIELLALEDVVGDLVGSLPHGRAKLVELGCALVTGPELLLLDEPAAGVSPTEADALGESLKGISAKFGVTILMIEHHVPLMLQTCDYIYVLNFGQMLTHGEPTEVARHPDVIAAYLGGIGKEASVAAAGGG